MNLVYWFCEISKHAHSMKTIVTTLLATITVMGALSAQAQQRAIASQLRGVVAQSTNDTLLIEEVAGDEMMMRSFMVFAPEHSDYEVHYKINSSRLNSMVKGTTSEMASLKAFIDLVKQDPSLRINSYIVTGYSSPDGSHDANEKLAQKRAQDFKAVLDKYFGEAMGREVEVDWVATNWEGCHHLVENSNIPNKSAVLSILSSSISQAEKERRIMALPASWSYMKRDILPELRRVELAINYDMGMLVQQQVRLVPVEVEVLAVESPQNDMMMVDLANLYNTSGYVVDIPSDSGIIRKEKHAAKKALKSQIDAEKLMDGRHPHHNAHSADRKGRKAIKKDAEAYRRAMHKAIREM